MAAHPDTLIDALKAKNSSTQLFTSLSLMFLLIQRTFRHKRTVHVEIDESED
jgi:hypothetical protein